MTVDDSNLLSIAALIAIVLALLAAGSRGAEVLEVAVRDHGLVAAVEDTNLETVDLRVTLNSIKTSVLEIFERLVDELISANGLGDLLSRLVVGDKLGRVGQIDTVDVGVGDFGRTRSQDDLGGTSFSAHEDNLAGCRAADDGVVGEEDDLASKLGADGRQLSADALLAL